MTIINNEKKESKNLFKKLENYYKRLFSKFNVNLENEDDETRQHENSSNGADDKNNEEEKN